MAPAKRRSYNLKKSNPRVKRIALLLESDKAFDRAIARGVGEYIRRQKDWIVMMDPMTKATTESIKHWNPDGILLSIHLPEIDQIAKEVDVPMVGFGSYSEETDGHLNFPIVTSEQEEIGRLAAKHFMNKGMKHFAFCGGDETALWCRQRQAGFQKELSAYGYDCAVYTPDFELPTNMPDAVRSMGKWLEKLPKPTGVFVFFDGWARWVLDACVIKNLKVPQEVSVIGVDNDRWLCELSQPRLSSVDPNVETAGYSAANILNDLMQGKHSGPKLSHISPAIVEERDSSSFLGFEDPEVAIAMNYIKEHACDPITPADVLKVTGMSNSTAYRKFMKTLGRSIHSEIQRVQMERVKELLTTTNLNVTEVARESGFDNIRYLTKVFRDINGMTPTEFRRRSSTPTVTDLNNRR